MDTFERIKVISETAQEAMIGHFEETFTPLLSADVSSYARGRKRLWLQAEPTLSRDFTLSKAVEDERTWSWILKHVWPEADLGLVSRGPVGIGMHRDATYAGWIAYGINLGETVTWGYQESYKTYKYSSQDDSAPVSELTLEPGEVFRFNPKNRHGVLSPITEKRWSVNLWKFK
jgi:hypothetical protein